MYSQLRNSAIFGNPIKLTFAEETSIPGTPGHSDKVNYHKGDLQSFLESTYDPAFKLVESSWTQHVVSHPAWGSFAGAFTMLASPASTSTELLDRARKLDSLTKDQTLVACAQNSLLSQRSKALLCADSTDYDPKLHSGENAEILAQTRSRTFLGTPVVRDQISWLVRYTGLAAPAFNFAPGGASTGTPLTLKQLATSTSPTPYGRELLYGGLMMTDIAIAQQALAYGDLTALFIYETLWDPKVKSLKKAETPQETWAMTLLTNKNNPWLQRNVAMIILQNAQKKCGDKPCGADLSYEIGILGPFYELTKTPTASSKTASTPNSTDAPTLLPLNPEKRQAAKEWFLTMFDLAADTTLHEIEMSPDDHPVPRRVAMSLGGVLLQLPTAKDWTSKKLDYPVALADRIADRNLLAARWSDYAAFDGMDSNAKVRLYTAMALGE
jgi:hypothetical protein